MDAQARAFEYEIAQLSERAPDVHTVLEKQRLYARVGQFLMGSFDGHWWCRYPSLMVFMMRLLELYPATESVRVLYEKMAVQLGLCCKCVDIYHASLPSVRIELEYEFTAASISAFFAKVAQLDAERIHSALALKSVDPSGGALLANLAKASRTEKERIATIVSTTLYEVLSQRRLVSDFRIVRSLSKWLSTAPPDLRELLDLELLRECPGVYQLLVSPDSGVRAWGIALVRKLGAIDLASDSGHDHAFVKVLDEWMYILESASFNVSVLTLDLQTTEELPLFLETTNCIKTPTNQILWAALDTVMQQMDETSLEVLLESFDNLPDLVFNYLNDADPANTNQQVTFVICKCYAVMLRCLGHRFWNHTVHSPKVVLDMVMQHCALPSWRVYVTKQLVELLPPLLASSRPPQLSIKQSNRLKLDFYLDARERLLRFLIDDARRPAHFAESTLQVAARRAVSTIICDCYDPRLLSASAARDSGKQTPAPRDDGALPESQLIDYSVSESAFWWPCGLNSSRASGGGSGGGSSLEPLWATCLFETIVNPEGVTALIDHAATTCSTILSKHLQLARDVVFTFLIRGDGDAAGAGAGNAASQPRMEAMTKSKPIITLLLERLCAWKAIATIPVAVHGALFESIGGISEILNVVDAHQARASVEVVSFTAVLKQYQLHLMAYLERICDEVLVKGLMNPLRFPVVAQHTTLCLLNPTTAVDQSMKRLLAHVAAAKTPGPAKQQSVLESFLISVHRNTEAFLRGVLSLLQSLRLFDFDVVVALPTLKKIVFIWTKVFEMLGASLQKILDDAAASADAASSGNGRSLSSSSSSSPSVNLQRLPVLINDFLVALLSGLYGTSTSAAPVPVDEAVLVRILDFAVTFWVFWTEVLKDKNAATKRSAALIAPLTRCIASGSVAQRPRAAELLMLVLETLLRGNVPLDDTALRHVESVKSVAAAIESKRSTDFARMAHKFRQLDRSAGFFARRSVSANWGTSRDSELSKAQSSTARQSSAQLSSVSASSAARAPVRARKHGETIDLTVSTTSGSARASSGSASGSRGTASTRPMSGKAAARAQSRSTVDLTGVGDAYADALARKNHSFYTESDYVTPRTREPSLMDRTGSSGSGKSKGARADFSISQVVRGLAHAHGTANAPSSPSARESSTASADDRLAVTAAMREKQAQAADDEAQDAALQFAGLFHRIKHTQKPIPVCSLLPFYRQLLQLCMPQLLTRAFESERSDRVLPAPELSFHKSAEYVGAYLPLLLEESSNELHEGLRKFHSASSGHLLRYESEKPREGMRCLSFTIADVDESVVEQSFFFKQRHGSRGTPKDKVFRNGDVVLLRHVGSGGGGAGAGGAGSGVGGELSARHRAGFLGSREFLGVVLISEVEKGKRRVAPVDRSKRDAGGAGGASGASGGARHQEDESVKVLFLNDCELDSVTEDVSAFSVETLSASAIADSEWRVHCVANLTTAAREYISLRSVDLLPEHLRTTILTPNVYKSTQTELLLATTVLDELRSASTTDATAKVVKLLKRLDKMDVTLMDLRSTSIGKVVNKLRKHADADVKTLASRLKDKWTQLMGEPDALERAPRFLSTDLWDAIKAQYNQSQLQSVHSVLNNYNVGISLLQGPPGTGKTKTIMGLLSGFLALQPPAVAIMPSTIAAAAKSGGASARSDKPPTPSPEAVASAQLAAATPRPTFSLSSVTSAMGSILRRSDADTSTSAPKRTTIQALKNVSSVRSRLEDKLSARKPSSSGSTPSSLVVRQRVVTSGPRVRRSNNVLLCAPSNGAVDELVLRIVTDGLMDSSGKAVKVRAPSVHPDALSEDWLSIVRLGNPGEDAPDSVKAVCLPQIIKRELEIHPKALQLRTLQDTQQALRKSIKDFHQRAKDAAAEAAAASSSAQQAPRESRKGLAQIHAKLTKCSGEVRRLRDEVFALRTKMTAAILSRASIIACTLSKSGSGPLAGLQRGFDALIIDEAAQAVELSTLVPIRERVARVVLVGDPKQLPATVKSVVAASARYDRSLFERIAASGVAPSMLRVQYRMHPFLREFPSKRFYNGMLTDGASVMERVQRVCPGVYKFPCFQPFLVYDVTNSSEDSGGGGSKYNRVEAQFCLQLCAALFAMSADAQRQNWSVGLVSPYKEQVRVLRRELAHSNVPSSVSVEVNTVDGFQGREKDVIVFSCVRASARGGIGFLKDVRRLNVAVTRARFCLFVVGHVDTLVRDETWAALVRSAADRRLVVRTHGRSFDDVARRLASEENRSLAAHFEEMHEKVAKKQVAPVVVPVPVETAETAVEGVTAASVGTVGAAAAVASGSPESSVATTAAADDKTMLSSAQVSSRSSETPSGDTTAGTSATDSPSLASTGADSRNDTSSATAAAAAASGSDSRPTHSDSISSARSGTDTGNHSGSSNTGGHSRSYRDSNRERRSRSRDRRDSSSRHNDDRYRKREYSDIRERQSVDRPHDDWAKRARHDHYPGDSRYSPREPPGDRRSNASRHDARRSRPSASGGGTAAIEPPVPPLSISAKEFCMANEPAPRRAGDRTGSTGNVTSSGASSHDARDRFKRPRDDASAPPPMFPPGHRFHVREQRSQHSVSSPSSRSGGSSSRSGHRFVSMTTSAASGGISHSRPPNGRAPSSGPSSSRPGSSGGGGGGGVLGNILGSASRLASATSRVQDKTVDRSREFQ